MSLRANKIINICSESKSENFLMICHKWELVWRFSYYIGYHRAVVGFNWVCPVRWPTGLLKEESRTERHVLQGPGYEATDQSYSRTVNEIRLAGRRWNVLLILKKGLLWMWFQLEVIIEIENWCWNWKIYYWHLSKR